MSKYELIEINGRQLSVDISMLTKTGVVSFNATQLAKPFGKRPIDWLKTEPAKEYIADVLNDSGSDLNHFEDIVKIKKGGKHQGTWMHKELALEFAGWCSAPFRRAMHKWVENRLAVESDRKRERLESKTGFLPMTDAISRKHEIPKPYHFSNECDMLNRIVLGMSAKEYRTKYGVDNVRDNLDADEIAMLAHLQRIDTGLIEIGMPYGDRKEQLKRCFQDGLTRLPRLRKLAAA